ncbi:MAG: ATP-binding protein [Chitinophagales bacterium]|nr:ATP-binding protein [Chitinophagales bacterium]
MTEPLKKIIFNGQPTIRLSQQESILSLLKEEELVKPAHDEFKKLYLADHSNSVNAGGGISFSFSFLNANKLTKKYNNLKKIQESELETPLKFFFLSKADKKTLATIKQRFSDIFPQVEDIKIAPLETKDKEMPDFLKDYPFIQIKEKGVKDWISQNRISSGMFRSLMQLSELYLCSEGTIFLIDEFENSLGINCINEITHDILASRRQLQFILTSHHPYIIDTIGFNNWKLVTRNAGIIKTHDISKFNIGKSKHSAFMQLLQLEEYQTGQEQL